MVDESNPSRWWFGVTIVPLYTAVSLVFYYAVLPLYKWAIHNQASVPDTVGSVLVLLYSVSIFTVFIGSYLAPLTLPVSLYFDARAIERSACSWNPNAVFWGGISLVQLGAWGNPSPGSGWSSELVYVFTVPLALYYLYVRHQYVGTP